MSDLFQGQSASLILDAGKVFRISTAGVATVKSAYGAPAGTITLTAQSRDFGPYDVSAKLELTAVAGAPSYLTRGLLGPAVTQDPSTGQFANANGNAITVSGAWYENTTLIFGDSHSSRSGPIYTARGAGPGYELSDDLAGGAVALGGQDGYFNQAQIMSGWMFRVLYNAAVGGETIAQVNARIDAAMKKYAPRFACYMAGTNDAQNSGITSIATADAAAVAMIAGIMEGWTKIRSYGAVVLAWTLPPRTSLNGFQRRVWAQVNSWIRTNAQRLPGVYFAGDVARLAGNPATGDWLASGEYGAVVSADSDGIHGAPYGYYLGGCDSAPRLAALLPTRRQGFATQEVAYDATNGSNPYGNLLLNGKMLGTGGTTSTATGSLAASWDVQGGPTAPTGGSIVLSKVALNIPSADATAADDIGEWQQVTMSGGTTEGNIHIRQFSLLGWKIGDVIAGSLKFETDATNWDQNGVGASDPILTIEFNANGANGKISYGQNGSAVRMGRKPKGTIRTPEGKIPAGTTDVYVRVYFRGQGTWRIRDVEVRVMPDRTASGI